MSRPYMPIYISDLLAEAENLNAMEFGAYMLLLMFYWDNRGLPDEERRLGYIIRSYDGKDWRKVRTKIKALFGPNWTHAKLDVELKKRRPGGEWGVEIFGERLTGPEWQVLRWRVFKRDNYRCRYCGEDRVILHCDHMVPVSRGGSNDESNLVAACGSCNSSKGAKLLSEWLQ